VSDPATSASHSTGCTRELLVGEHVSRRSPMPQSIGHAMEVSHVDTQARDPRPAR
jgi:hypothetical protein